MSINNQKFAVISGGSSGLAECSINLLRENGYIVFSLDISYKEIKEKDGLYEIPCDITNNNSLLEAKEYISSITDHVDLIANFAGIVILGSLIESGLDDLNKIMNVNLIGTYKVNNIFFEFVAKCKGRIINISSEYGLLDAIPFHTFYPISKHAIEVYNDGLRRELQFHGVKVIAIRPGAFKTKMQGGIQKQFDTLVNETVYYKDSLKKMQFIMTGELDKAKPVRKFVKTFKKAAFKKNPKKYYNVGNSFKMKLLSALPSSLQDLIFRHFF